MFETLLHVLPVPGGDKEWYLYAARAGLPIGVVSHRSYVSLTRSPVAKAPTNRPAPPPFSSIMARRRRWLAPKVEVSWFGATRSFRSSSRAPKGRGDPGPQTVDCGSWIASPSARNDGVWVTTLVVTTSPWRSRRNPNSGCSSRFLRPARRRRRAGGRTAFHHDETGALEMFDKPFRHDLRHDLVGVVRSLAAVETEREGERRGEIVGRRGQ